MAETKNTEPRELNLNEENFTLIRSFNDIFVSLASLLVVISICYLTFAYIRPIMFLPGAAFCWLLAELFTRKRRMALPSITYAFLCPALAGYSVFALLNVDLLDVRNLPTMGEDTEINIFGWSFFASIEAAFIVAGLISYAFWRRFHVPISIAGCSLALIGSIVTLAFWVDVYVNLSIYFIVFGIGLIVFAVYWDRKNTSRISYQSDIAFWLHVFGAPMLVSSVMPSVYLYGGPYMHFDQAIAVLGIFAFLTVCALLLDRRAILVASIIYVLSALNTILENANAKVALSGLILGLILLALSIWWRPIREAFLKLLPEYIKVNLPA